MQSVAKTCVQLFYFALIQFALGWCLLGSGIPEKDGGNQAVFIASVCCGIVMSLSSVVGWLSSLSGNEEYIQRFMVSSLVTMSFLTTFLYLNIKYAWDNNQADVPSTGKLGPSADESAAQATNITQSVISLVFSILALVITFLNCLTCQQALDTINDLGSLQDDALVFRYFQVRLTELKKTCEQLSFAHYKQVPKTDGQYTGPKSLTQWWTRSHTAYCGCEFPNIRGNINTNKSTAVTSGVVDNAVAGDDGYDDIVDGVDGDGDGPPEPREAPPPSKMGAFPSFRKN
jgi:hypothetical protein